MRTLRNFIRSLADLPRGSAADGRRIGVGLDAALQAQRARGTEAKPLTTPVATPRPVVHEERPFTRV